MPDVDTDGAPMDHEGDSWIDWLIETIEGWRWPALVSLTVMALIGIAAMHGFYWLEGSLEPGTFSLYHASIPLYPFGILAVLTLQNRIARGAVRRFRPATILDDAGYQDLLYQVSHQPARGALVSAIALGALGVTIELSKGDVAGKFADGPVFLVIEMLIAFASYSFAGPWFVRIVRLLRTVDQVHREALNVDLMRPDPVHAFSSVTAWASVSLIAIATLSITTDPATHATAAGLILTLWLIVLAVVAFALPLWGMHRRLQAERARRIDAVGARIDATMERLYRHVDEDASGASEVRDRLLALSSARDIVASASTWPWRPETPRWPVSALVVPLILWGVTRLLERAVL